MSRSYPSLGDIPGHLPEEPMRICIVTPDLLGPVKNGGIGTACSYLAYVLAADDNDVNILFCQTGSDDPGDAWMANYAARGICTTKLAARQPDSSGFFPDLPQLIISKAVYDWLRAQPSFDMILFMDWQGAGFYAMHAKACGLAFENTALGVIIHSPTYWHNINNGSVAANPLEACLWHMERRAMGMADFVVSPSRYMPGWVEERMCRLPKHAYAQPNLLELDAKYRHNSDKPIDEVIFFGRLELRKGLNEFCSALDRLAQTGKLPPKVTFLGKSAWIGHEHSVLYIMQRAEKWHGCDLRIETQKGHAAAIAYICGAGRLAIIPSIADNSPYTVYECLLAGVPFLARDVGGIREFMPEREWSEFLFGDNPSQLAAKISACLGKPPRRATLAIDQAANCKAWCDGLKKLAKLLPRPEGEKTLPFISIILCHYNRPEFLRQAVDSLLQQDYENFEVVLADDGSTDVHALRLLKELEPVFGARGWRILRLTNGYAGAARNRAAKAAKGDWLLFFDDDNIMKPGMLKKCAKAASCRKTGYIPIMFQVFEGNHAPSVQNQAEIFLPTGDAIAYGVLVNTLGDTTALIHRDTFTGIGGFTEDYGLGHEDYELFLRLALMGVPCAIIPEPLFWYRKGKRKASVQQNTNGDLNRMRSLRPFLELLPPHLAELALMTHGMGAALRIYPETTRQGFIEMQLDYHADPSSPANMATVANILAAQGKTEISGRILATLPGMEKSTQAALLQTRALTAARLGNLKNIRALLAEFSQLKLDDEYAPPICSAILDNLELPAEQLRADILKWINGLQHKTPLTWIILSQHAKGDMAASLFLEGIACADEIYLTGRPDVRAAIQEKAFICGLQHFALHGFADNMAWPERARFRKLLQRRPELVRPVLIGHMHRWNYDDVNLAQKMVGILAAE